MARNSLASAIEFASESTGGRLVVETFGDSTSERNGNGWAYGWQAYLAQVAPCAGILVPPNHNSGSSETHGYWQARRIGNGNTSATQYGCVDPVDYTSQGGYPLTYKQYGIQVPLRNSWQGPQCAFYAHTTLSSGINTAVTTIPVTDGSVFSNGAAKRLYIFDGTQTECILYTNTAAASQVTSVTRASPGFTALCTGPAGAGNAQAFSAGAIITQMDNSNSSGFRIWPSHPLNPDADLYSSVWSMSTYASAAAAPAATFSMEASSTATPTTATYDPLSPTVGPTVTASKAGSALGTISRNDQTITRGSRESVSLAVPYNDASVAGPFGPNCILYHGLLAKDRPYGWIPSMGISQGGKRLNDMIFDLRRYHAATGTVQFDLGMVARFKVYIDAAASAIGGNTRAGFCGFYAGGHNDAAAGNYNALVMPDVPWTIYQTYFTSSLNISDTSVAVSNTTGLNASGGTIRLDDEYMTYTGFTTNTSINGLTRGCFGTQAADHSGGGDIYLGFPLQHPRGMITDMLWYYRHLKSLWVTAGGNADYFWFIWPRPIPTSASPSAVDDFSGIANNDQKEYKLRRYMDAFNTYLKGNYDGLVGLDSGAVWGGSEGLDLDYSDFGPDDPVHHKRTGYALAAGKLATMDAAENGFMGTGGAARFRKPRGRGR